MGLVCWRYTLEGRLPPLEANSGPDAFDLFMCEEDGTVDRDFPCLDHSPISEPLSLFALKNVAVKGHTQGQIKGMVDSGSPVIGLLNLVEP